MKEHQKPQAFEARFPRGLPYSPLLADSVDAASTREVVRQFRLCQKAINAGMLPGLTLGLGEQNANCWFFRYRVSNGDWAGAELFGTLTFNGRRDKGASDEVARFPEHAPYLALFTPTGFFHETSSLVMICVPGLSSGHLQEWSAAWNGNLAGTKRPTFEMVSGAATAGSGDGIGGGNSGGAARVLKRKRDESLFALPRLDGSITNWWLHVCAAFELGASGFDAIHGVHGGYRQEAVRVNWTSATAVTPAMKVFARLEDGGDGSTPPPAAAAATARVDELRRDAAALLAQQQACAADSAQWNQTHLPEELLSLFDEVEGGGNAMDEAAGGGGGGGGAAAIGSSAPAAGDRLWRGAATRSARRHVGDTTALDKGGQEEEKGLEG